MRIKIFRVWALVLVLFMAACQSTPDSEIVVNKNQENLIDKAADPSKGTGMLAEKLGVPAEFKLESKTAGKLKLQANAKVIVPEANQIPILRVKASDFSQEQVKAYFDYLCKGLVMNKSKTEITKSEIEERILQFQKEIADSTSNKQQKESLEKEVKRLQEQYEVAPESIPDVPADGMLETGEMKNPYTGEVYARRQMISATEKTKNGGDGKRFYVYNNSDQKEPLIFEQEGDSSTKSVYPKEKGASLGFNSPEDNFYNIEQAEIVTESYVPDARVSKDFNLTVAEAKAQVQELLDATKMPLEIYQIRLVKCEEYEQSEDGSGTSMSEGRAQVVNDEKVEAGESSSMGEPPMATPKVTTKYAYQFSCRRMVENIPCAEIIGTLTFYGGGEGEDSPNYNLLQESWIYEEFNVKVTENGIISVHWYSPLDVTDKLVEDCALKPFSEIQSIFEKMMSVKYEFATESDYLEELKYSIDRVELELMRVLEQDSMETGLLVPVWRFYGTQEMKYKMEEGQEGDPPAAKGCWLTLNAVDGAIIDEQKGY